MNALFGPIIHQYKNRKNVEVELRFGKISQNKFDTNVGKERFEKILEGLKKYNGWESVVSSHTTAYIKGDLRVIDDEKTGDTTCHKKTKIKKIDFSLKDQPLDIRLSVATETDCARPTDSEFDDMRIRHRESFVRKNLVIDMTRVTGNPDDPDSEETEKYEVELEIIDATEVKDDILLSNILQKVFDVLKLLV